MVSVGEQPLDELSDEVLLQEMSVIKEKRQTLEQELQVLEKKIYNLETSYLQDSNHVGNLVKGWSGYLSSRSSNLKKQRFKESDRVFTLSSVDAIHNIEIGNGRDKRSGRQKYHPYKIQKSRASRRAVMDSDDDNED